MMQMLNWKVEAQKQRLRLCAVEAAGEVSFLLAATYVSATQLEHSTFFVRFLSLPIFIGIWRTAIAFWLMSVYRQMEHQDVAVSLRRLSNGFSVGYWVCAGACLAVLSCSMAMWHGFWFVLMLWCYEGAPAETTVLFLMSIAAVGFMTVNGAMWWHCGRIIRDLPDKPDNDGIFLRLDRIRRSRTIRLAPFRVLAAEAEIARALSKEKDVPELPPARLLKPESCVVCLEDYTPDDVLAQLPCGHIFHPSCVHQWLGEGWRCPFRCSLGFLDKTRKAYALRPDVSVSWAWP